MEKPLSHEMKIRGGSSRTVDYYNDNARTFFETTVNADMSLQLEDFIRLLPAGGLVLDAGCGSGRDSRALLKRGFQVDAFDASHEMCRMASELTGQPVRLCRFEELEDVNRFDGIWACASLLHVAAADMPGVIRRLHRALKPGGILYASFKKGTGERMRGERKFTDADEAYLRQLLEDGFEILEIRESVDVRPGREDEAWINAFARRRPG